jgi:hypothetical protein
LPKLREVEASASRPRIARFADHQIITPVNHLRRAISETPGDNVENDAVARAEKALAALSEKFPIWMQAEWARLAFAHAAIAADGFTEDATAKLLQISHDIRVNAPLYGYAAAADIAGSLCRLIEDIADRDALPRGLVARHVDAIGAIARGAKNVPSAMELRLSATQHLLRESAITIPAPSLAPE